MYQQCRRHSMSNNLDLVQIVDLLSMNWHLTTFSFPLVDDLDEFPLNNFRLVEIEKRVSEYRDDD